MKNKNSYYRSGFTIIELVIVIAVIALLASVLIPVYTGIIEKARNVTELENKHNNDTISQVSEILTDGENVPSVFDYDNAEDYLCMYPKYPEDSEPFWLLIDPADNNFVIVAGNKYSDPSVKGKIESDGDGYIAFSDEGEKYYFKKTERDLVLLLADSENDKMNIPHGSKFGRVYRIPVQYTPVD